MAIITKIREQSMLAIGVVAIAMIAFILGGDLLSGNSWVLNKIAGPAQQVGEIDGTKIGLEEFNLASNEVRTLFVDVYGREPQDEEMDRLRQQTWQMMMYKYAYGGEFEELGLTISKKELTDMLSGNNINPGVSAYFQRDGQVDKAMLNQFLAGYRENPRMNALFRWITYPLQEDRKFEKYTSLLTSSTYASKAEAKREYEEQNTKADLQLLYVPYGSIVDSTVKVDDNMLMAYYKANPKKYERDANRSLEYLTFPLVATADDEKLVMDELAAEVDAFKKAENDSAFVEAKSEGANNFLTSNLGELPAELNIGTPVVGEVYGPVKQDKVYKLYKVIGTEQDSVYWMRASHILFKLEAPNAKEEALRVLKEIQGGADFAAMAGQYGTDGTKTRGGDLGWFPEGRMVDAFNKAVLNASGTGLIPTLVETQFGFHIVKVTGAKTKTRVKMATIEKEITASQETVDALYRRVGEFRKHTTYEELKAAVEKEKGMILLQALNVAKNGTSINNLTGPSVRQVIRWAYSDDTEIGQVSEDFDIDNQYMIAVLRGKREKGLAPFEDVKEEVKAEVIRLEKQKMILSKMAGLTGDLDAMAKAYGQGASVFHNDDTSLNGFSLARVGFAPKTLGVISKMKAGEVSKAIADESGVVVVKLEGIKPPVETADYASYRERIQERRSGSIYFEIQQAIEKAKGVEDTRYKYF